MQNPKWGNERSAGPRRGRWSAEEIARFKELYGLREDAAIARDLNRSVASIRKMAKSLFDSKLRNGPWTSAEDEELKKYLGATDVETIATILGRRKKDVQDKIAEFARVQHGGDWSHEHLNEFKRLYGTRTDEDLALIFGRRLDDVRALADTLCIAKDKAFLRKRSGGRQATKMPRWKDEELDALKELYPTHSNLSIAKRLSRSVKSVVSKAHNLGLKKDPSRLREMGRQNVSLRYGRQD